MKIRGREIGFLRTVKATCDLIKISPDRNIDRIGELFSGDLASTMENGAKLIHFLNEGYEMSKHFEDPSYKPNILSVDEILYLPQDEYKALLDRAMESFGNGAEQEVELEETKKNGAEE